MSGGFHRLLALASVLVACRAGAGATATPSRTPHGQGGASVTNDPRPTVVADRGVVYGSDAVRIVASWRSDVDPRGTVIVFSEKKASEAVVTANRVLDAGFNYAFVESASQPISRRMEVAAAIANDKSLNHRQRLEQGRQRQPAITVFWLDDREGERVVEILRAHPPFRVQAAIVLTPDGPPRRHTFASDSTGEIRVLEVRTPLDEAAWAEIFRFMEDVVRDLLGERPTA